MRYMGSNVVSPTAAEGRKSSTPTSCPNKPRPPFQVPKPEENVKTES